MTNRTARLAALAAIIVGAIMIGILALRLADHLDSMITDLPTAPIMEDDPRWDCATMGNRICGPGN